MSITDQFGMNFTSVRLAGTELWVHGETSPETAFSADVEAIHAAVFRPGAEQGDALAASMMEPELEWSTTFERPSPYGRDEQVYVVGVAMLRGKPPHAWSNLLTVIADTTLAPTSTPPAGRG